MVKLPWPGEPASAATHGQNTALAFALAVIGTAAFSNADANPPAAVKNSLDAFIYNAFQAMK
jgi:hypothetical protein